MRSKASFSPCASSRADAVDEIRNRLRVGVVRACQSGTRLEQGRNLVVGEARFGLEKIIELEGTVGPGCRGRSRRILAHIRRRRSRRGEQHRRFRAGGQIGEEDFQIVRQWRFGVAALAGASLGLGDRLGVREHREGRAPGLGQRVIHAPRPEAGRKRAAIIEEALPFGRADLAWTDGIRSRNLGANIHHLVAGILGFEDRPCNHIVGRDEPGRGLVQRVDGALRNEAFANEGRFVQDVAPLHGQAFLRHPSGLIVDLDLDKVARDVSGADDGHVSGQAIDGLAAGLIEQVGETFNQINCHG